MMQPLLYDQTTAHHTFTDEVVKTFNRTICVPCYIWVEIERVAGDGEAKQI
jgi:hypothetical protein